MYVAITRARKRLYLSHTQTRMLHGQTRYNPRSRFMDELPETSLKWLSPKLAPVTPMSPGAGWWGAVGGNNGRSAQPAWGRSALAAAPTPTAQNIPAQKATPAHGICAGQGVFHAKFGEGRVLTVEGAGDDARAQVSFARHGTKWLALAVAKLTPI